MTKVHEKLEALQNTIKTAIGTSLDDSKFMAVAAVFNCIEISFETVTSHALNQIAGLEDAGEELMRILQTKLAKNIFNKKYESEPNAHELNASFEECESSIYSQLKILINDENWNKKTIENKFNELKIKRRQTNNDEQWNEILSEFAAENFTLVGITQQLINISPPQVRLHLIEAGLNDIPGRYVWQTFTLIDNKNKIAGSDSEFVGDGFDYEHHIAELISTYVPEADIKVTKASGDQGADIVFMLNRHKVVIQTKLYSSPVGNDAVQQVYAAKRHYCATAAVVVSNSSYTKSAHELAESLQVALLHEDDVGPLFSRAFS